MFTALFGSLNGICILAPLNMLRALPFSFVPPVCLLESLEFLFY